MVCVMTSRMGKTTAATLQTEDEDWSGDYRGPLLDGWYVWSYCVCIYIVLYTYGILCTLLCVWRCNASVHVYR